MLQHWVKARRADYAGSPAVLINLARANSVRWDEGQQQTVLWFGGDDTIWVHERPEDLIEQVGKLAPKGTDA